MKTTPIRNNTKVKWGNSIGRIFKIEERYSYLADDMRTFISIEWDSGDIGDHLLTEFKRFGGQIEEIN